jgi:hypothetical protein
MMFAPSEISRVVGLGKFVQYLVPFLPRPGLVLVVG